MNSTKDQPFLDVKITYIAHTNTGNSAIFLTGQSHEIHRKKIKIRGCIITTVIFSCKACYY